MPRPRYRQLANSFRRDINDGKYGPGDAFPTEMEICRQNDVSRHTAREALRILSDDGLIERRQGSGTIVVGQGQPAFAQSLGDFESLLQYARDAHFEIEAVDDADAQTLDRLGLTGDYRRLRGLRRVRGAQAQAVTTILVRRDLAPDAAAGDHLSGALSEWVERTHGVAIERVMQRMEAVGLAPDAAAALGLAEGTPALRTVRRFRDHEDTVLLLSESLYPAGRFAYEMRFKRR